MILLHLKGVPIFEQLQLEEALLRTSTENICLINEGSTPAIVMGISGKPEKLVNMPLLEKKPIPLIKRFSGGGTVIVGPETVFISFLFNRDFHDFLPYPEPIMRWTEEIYKTAIDHPEFSLRENDYVIGPKKFGGNAQYLRKDRWLHHSTLLWDFTEQEMDYLLHPEKAPKYREGRSHLDFLCKLNEHFPSKEMFVTRFKKALSARHPFEEKTAGDFAHLVQGDHRKSTTLLF